MVEVQESLTYEVRLDVFYLEDVLEEEKGRMEHIDRGDEFLQDLITEDKALIQPVKERFMCPVCQ